MKKQVIASLLMFSGLSCSFAVFANNVPVSGEITQPLMTESQIEEYKALHTRLGVTTIGNIEPFRKSLVADVNERLKTLKTPEQKLLFTMSMNAVTGGNFHVNDNSIVKLNKEEQNYFDTYYTFVLDHLNKEISVGEQTKEQLIAQYEKTFPFKFYERDLNKFLASDK